MTFPILVSFHGLQHSDALEDRIRHEAAGLGKLAPRITSCRVTLEPSHNAHDKPRHWEVHVTVGMPGEDVVVSRPHHDNAAHQDPYLAVRDAFRAVRRQLRDATAKRRARQSAS